MATLQNSERDNPLTPLWDGCDPCQRGSGVGVPPNPTWCGHNSPHGVLSLFVLFYVFFFLDYFVLGESDAERILMYRSEETFVTWIYGHVAEAPLDDQFLVKMLY